MHMTALDLGPFIDPALLDLCMKSGMLLCAVIIILLLIKQMGVTKRGFEATGTVPLLEEQMTEFKRQAALFQAQVDACKQEIAVLKRQMGEGTEQYSRLALKYEALLLRLVDLEKKLSFAVKHISLPNQQETHTGDTNRPLPIPRGPFERKPSSLPPVPRAVHTSLSKGDMPAIGKKPPPIPREDK